MPGAPVSRRRCRSASKNRGGAGTRRKQTTAQEKENRWQNKEADAPSRRRRGPQAATRPSRGKKQYFRRKKVCRFCVEKIDDINYKDTRLLNGFISERGKITPRRISGVCTPHQRRLSEAIKQARNIALLPFASPV